MSHSGIFIKLDAEYCSDDEFIEAGPLPELLFIRGLAFCKRKKLDGVIARRQLVSVALGIPNPTKHAKVLCDVGLWEPVSEGWRIPSWLKHNKSAAELAADKEARRVASVEANHAQHHVGPGKKRSPKCELCRPDLVRKPAPISEPSPDPITAPRARGRGEGEPDGEPEPEPEGESVSAQDDSLGGVITDLAHMFLDEAS